MKKEERHQMKQDDLATLLEAGATYFQEHRRQVLTVGGIAVVAIALILGGRAYFNARSAQSARMLGDLIGTYNAQVTASLEDLGNAKAGVPTFTSTEERDRKVIEMADALLKRDGSGLSASGAALYKAMALAGLKRYDEAAPLLKSLADRDPGGVFGAMARLRLARLREEQGKADDAMPLYQAIADTKGSLVPQEEGILGLARCQETLGKPDEAMKLYRRLMSDFPDSEYASEARTHLDAEDHS